MATKAKTTTTAPVPEAAAKKAGGTLAKKEEHLPAAAGLSFEEDAGMGLEGADKASFAIPFIFILQPLSPVVAESTVEGAKAGMFMNNITNELFTEVDVVPVAFQRRFLRWAPRKLGGGYKGEYNPADVESGAVEGVVRDESGRYWFDGTDKDANDALKDTRMHFVLLVRDDGSFTPALISMASTQIKRSKKWLSRIQNIQVRGASGKLFTPPSFSHVYRLTTVKESNDQGIWWSYEIDTKGPVQDPELYAAAKAFHAQVATGAVEVAPPVADVDAADDGEKF